MSTDALLQRALDEIVRQREELAEFRARDHTRVDMHAPEPIAIVGLGCRFPGQSDSPAAYWSLLERGADEGWAVGRDSHRAELAEGQGVVW